MNDKFDDIKEFEFESHENDLIGRHSELIEAGFDEDYADQWLAHINQLEEDKISEEVKESGLNSALSDEDFERQYEIIKRKNSEVFDEKPKKPKIFKKILKKFTPKFQLRSAQKFTLAGEQREVKKINFNDTLRLISKLPMWANYIGFNTPEMLIDPLTGRYRFTKTVMTLLERALGEENYDFENNRPSDFQLSVIEELAFLLNVSQDDLLSSDPEEVLDAIEILINVNQRFFLRLWNKSGPIKELFSMISGKITHYIEKEKEKQKAESEEDSQTMNEE